MSTLPLFWDLSSNTKSSRIDASVKLINALEQFQGNFNPPLDSSESSEDEDEETLPGATPNVDLEKLNASDVAYSIRRLIRGLASPRESSRLGFAVALTELLSRLNSVTASQILSLIMQHSQIHGSMKGQEERDMLFARLFGVTALAQSRLLFRSAPLANSSLPQCTAKEFQDSFEILLTLSKKKSFLKEPSFWTIVLCLRTLHSSTVEWKEDMFAHVIENLFVQDKSWSPEKLAVVLVLQDLGVKADWKTLLSSTFKSEDILSLANLHTVAKILKEVDIEEGESTKSQGNWKPQLHFVWDVILDVYFPPENAQSSINHKASYPEFFKAVIDDSLLSATSSDGRKLWGFELFRLSSSKISPSDLPRLFTSNFMRSWLNHLSKPDRYLHKAATLVASALPSIVTTNPTIGFPILLQLLQTHGQFDRLTRTKTVESLLAAMDLNGVEQYVHHLIELAQKPDTEIDDEDPTSIRTWVFDQFHMLIRNGSIPQTDTWITDVLDFLLLHGLYTIREVYDKSPSRSLRHLPKPVFSDEARRACRSRLLTCLAELTSRQSIVQAEDGKSTRYTGCASDGQLWISKVLQQFVSLNKDSKHVSRIKLPKMNPDEDAQSEDLVSKAIQSIAIIPSDTKDVKNGFELLLSATLLHHFLSENNDNAEDIQVCITNIELLSTKSQSPKKKKKQLSDDHDHEPTPIAALVDTLIGYLDKSTSFLRTVANQSFSFLTSLVDRESVDLILAQLERRDLAEEEEEELMQVDAVSEGSGSAESDSEDEDESEDQDDAEDDPELRKKIMEAFGNVGLDVPSGKLDESEEGTDSEGDEEPMNDEQMFQLDEQLADIFRSRTKAKGNIGAQREATHFKNRVLDLVDIYLREEPTSEHVPVFILPLVRALLGTGIDEKQLSDKVTSLLRNRYGKTKAIPPSTDMSIVRETLQELHNIARKSSASNVKGIIPVCNMYVVRVYFSDSSSDKAFVHQVYLDSLKDFTSRKASPLQPGFFNEAFRRYPGIVWASRKQFMDLSRSAVKGYRKVQVLSFLSAMFHQSSALNADDAALIEFLKEFISMFQSIVLEACETNSLNMAHMKELFKLVVKVMRQAERIFKDETKHRDAWVNTDLESLEEFLRKSKFGSNPALISMLHELRSLISHQNSDTTGKEKDQKKRKAEDSKPSDSHKKAKRNLKT